MKKGTILIVIVLILVCFFSFWLFKEDKEESIEEKVDSELEYMDVELIKIMNKLNNINFSTYTITTKSEEENNQGNKINVSEMVSQPSMNTDINNIDWKSIAFALETLSDSWNTIILDLYKLNIKSETINKFSDTLNQTLISVKNEDKITSLTLISMLYSYIPNFIGNYSSDSNKFYIANAKWHVLNSYVGASKNDWEYSNSELGLAEDSITNVMKNEEIITKKGYNVNRVYVSIKELENSNQYKDIKVFFLRYKNLIQELETV